MHPKFIGFQEGFRRKLCLESLMQASLIQEFYIIVQVNFFILIMTNILLRKILAMENQLLVWKFQLVQIYTLKKLGFKRGK